MPEETNWRNLDIISDDNCYYNEHVSRYLGEKGLLKERTYVDC